jgi:hypothetical protein
MGKGKNVTEYRHVSRKLKYMGTWEKTGKNSGNVCYIGLLTKNTKKISIPGLVLFKRRDRGHNRN